MVSESFGVESEFFYLSLGRNSGIGFFWRWFQIVCADLERLVEAASSFPSTSSAWRRRRVTESLDVLVEGSSS
jgi:hypothetical protein